MKQENKLIKKRSTFIPVKTKPREISQHGFLGFSSRSLQVGVFNSQNKFASFGPGKQVIEERSSSSTDVKIPGGWRGETHADLFFILLLRSGWDWEAAPLAENGGRSNLRNYPNPHPRRSGSNQSRCHFHCTAQTKDNSQIWNEICIQIPWRGSTRVLF